MKSHLFTNALEEAKPLPVSIACNTLKAHFDQQTILATPFSSILNVELVRSNKVQRVPPA